ncbi:hypothetical protein EKO04_011625 [Ascochyta lentis]|uniref:Uncharacterized protein n=1 Tax=Ascochyta lentis TaxID=205686 RepID=A0A8H7IW42_9PLEO|nr:hypothetical protein EKO04_011625 [Ascochyta lentis]
MNYSVGVEDAIFRINLEELKKEYLNSVLTIEDVLRNDLLFNEPTRAMQGFFPHNLQYRFQVAMDQLQFLPYNEPNSGEGWKRGLMARILNDEGLAAMISDLQAEAARRATRRTVNRGNAYRTPAELRLNTTATEDNNYNININRIINNTNLNRIINNTNINTNINHIINNTNINPSINHHPNNINMNNNETTGGAAFEAPRPSASAVPEMKPYQAYCESVDGDEDEDVN